MYLAHYMVSKQLAVIKNTVLNVAKFFSYETNCISSIKRQ